MKNDIIKLTEDQIAKRLFLKIKIKHLAVEPRLIRDLHNARRRKAVNRKQPYSKWLEVRTRDHRLTAIRPEARAALLAYAFIRGKNYEVAESCDSISLPVITRVAEIVTKYGDYPHGTPKKKVLEEVRAWIVNGLAVRAARKAEEAVAA